MAWLNDYRQYVKEMLASDPTEVEKYIDEVSKAVRQLPPILGKLVTDYLRCLNPDDFITAEGLFAFLQSIDWTQYDIVRR